jgi:hypothetical protein
MGNPVGILAKATRPVAAVIRVQSLLGPVERCGNQVTRRRRLGSRWCAECLGYMGLRLDENHRAARARKPVPSGAAVRPEVFQGWRKLRQTEAFQE